MAEKFFIRSYQSMCAAPSFQTVRDNMGDALVEAHYRAPKYPGGRIVIDRTLGPDAQFAEREVIWDGEEAI